MKEINEKQRSHIHQRKRISVTLKPERNGGMLNQFAHCDEVMNFSVYVKLSGAYTCGDEEGRNDDHAF